MKSYGVVTYGMVMLYHYVKLNFQKPGARGECRPHPSIHALRAHSGRAAGVSNHANIGGRFLCGMVLFLILQPCHMLNAKTLQQMQDLYKNIGNDLMSIRKDFAAAQPKVYSILDRIDKMYNLAKITAEKKHHLSVTLKNQSGETNRLYAEINTLKSKIAANEEELLNTRKKLENVNDELEKARASQLSQERTQTPTHESEIHKVKTTPNSDKKQPDSKDFMHEIRNLKGLSEEEKNLLKQAQSLSLSSTSAPSSPR